MEINLSPYAYRQYKKLTPSLQNVLKEVISTLQDNPLPNGCKKLVGRDGYRLRYGDYRVIYTLNHHPREILILAIAHRREIYKF